MRYSRAVIERYYARRMHTWSARTDAQTAGEYQWPERFSTFFSTRPLYDPSASFTGRTHVIYILRHQYKPTRCIILFIA